MAEYYQLSVLEKYINMYFFSFSHLEIQEQGNGRYVLCLMSPLPGLQWLILVFPVSSHDLSLELNFHTIATHQTNKATISKHHGFGDKNYWNGIQTFNL